MCELADFCKPKATTINPNMNIDLKPKLDSKKLEKFLGPKNVCIYCSYAIKLYFLLAVNYNTVKYF